MAKKYIDVKPIIEAMIEHFNTLKTKAEIEYPEEIYGERRFTSDPQFAGPAACVKFWADKLAKEPAADVQEVKHGKNLKGDTPSLFKCSVCGEECWDTFLMDRQINYCYFCGAKMDGGEDDA